MLEHVPAWLGRLLADRRAGMDKIVAVQPGMAGSAALTLTSPAFADGGRLPERFTADGAGVSPPRRGPPRRSSASSTRSSSARR